MRGERLNDCSGFRFIIMKDPACLFYIDTWLSATAEMDSDVRGWYLNLILHQYDKKTLPNDFEKLAVLAGVKFSEFERFKQMFEQVLKHKFIVNDENRLENSYAKSILINREQFKDKRSKSGNIGVVIKTAKSINGFIDVYIEKLKKHLYSVSLEEIEKHKDKQVLEQMLKLYINENENKSINKDLVLDTIIPNFEIFKNYALEKEPTVKLSALKNKYDAWIANDWKDGNDKKIVKWKVKLLQTMPYIEKEIKQQEKYISPA